MKPSMCDRYGLGVVVEGVQVTECTLTEPRCERFRQLACPGIGQTIRLWGPCGVVGKGLASPERERAQQCGEEYPTSVFPRDWTRCGHGGEGVGSGSTWTCVGFASAHFRDIRRAGCFGLTK